VAGRLIYEAEDSDFADSAQDALEAAGIPCYCVNSGVRITGPLRGAKICIYIERPADYDRVNKILVGLGAAVEESLVAARYEVRFVLLAAAFVAALAAVASLLLK
jgi:hypothetical protein